MRQELDDLFSQRHPKIFRDRHGNIAETGMCWGFACEDDWFNIIVDRCAEITNQVNAGTMPPVIAMQIDEKFGFLRFYGHGHFKHDENPEAHRLIALAQQKAERTYEQCGVSITQTDRQRWSATCLKCESQGCTTSPPDDR